MAGLDGAGPNSGRCSDTDSCTYNGRCSGDGTCIVDVANCVYRPSCGESPSLENVSWSSRLNSHPPIQYACVPQESVAGLCTDANEDGLCDDLAGVCLYPPKGAGTRCGESIDDCDGPHECLDGSTACPLSLITPELPRAGTTTLQSSDASVDLPEKQVSTSTNHEFGSSQDTAHFIGATSIQVVVSNVDTTCGSVSYALGVYKTSVWTNPNESREPRTGESCPYNMTSLAESAPHLHSTVAGGQFVDDAMLSDERVDSRDGAQSWYTFADIQDEVVPSNALPNNGSIVGSPTRVVDQFNVSNEALRFDGNADYVSLHHSPLKGGQGDYSITAWIRLYGATTGTQGILGFESSASSCTRTAPSLFVDRGSGALQYKLCHYDSQRAPVPFETDAVGFFATTLAQGWHHVGWVKEGPRHSIYKDGHAFGQPQDAPTHAYFHSPSYWLGRVGDLYLDGALADVAFYNDAIRPATIMQQWQWNVRLGHRTPSASTLVLTREELDVADGDYLVAVVQVFDLYGRPDVPAQSLLWQLQFPNVPHPARTLCSSQFMVDSSVPVVSELDVGVCKCPWRGDRLDACPPCEICSSCTEPMVAIEWPRFYDPHSGMRSYEVMLAEEQSGQRVVDYLEIQFDAPADRYVERLSYVFEDTAVVMGRRYVATVRGTNAAGLSASVSSSVVIDTTPPEIEDAVVELHPSPAAPECIRALPNRFDGSTECGAVDQHPMPDIQTSDSHIHATWSGFSDDLSSIGRYTWAAGDCAGDETMYTEVHGGFLDVSHAGQLLRPWGCYATNPSQCHSRLNVLRTTYGLMQNGSAGYHNGNGSDIELQSALRSGMRFCVTIRAYNQNGLWSSVRSSPMLVDVDPPTLGWVNDGSTAYIDLDHQPHSNAVSAWWHSFRDPQSGVNTYQWSVGTLPNASDIVAWDTVGNTTEASAILVVQVPAPYNI